MKFVLVSVPPHLRLRCCSCGLQQETDREVFWADTEGTPFEAYYCSACKAREDS